MRFSMKQGLVLGFGLMLLAACSEDGSRVVSSSPQPARQHRQVDVHAISLDGSSLDLAGINQLDLCSSAGRCWPVTLLKSDEQVKADDHGDALLIGRAEVPATVLASVKLYAQGNVGVNATQSPLPQRVDLRRGEEGGAKVLLSLSANRSCTRFACLALRGAAGLVAQGEGQYVFYNPRADLRKDLSRQVSLEIPRGALADVRIFRIQVSEGSNYPGVDIHPVVDLERPAKVSLAGKGRNARPLSLEIRRTDNISNGVADAGMLVQH